MAKSGSKPKAEKAVRSRMLKASIKGISLGKSKVTLGISIEREDLSLEVADAILTGASLDMRIIPAQDVDGQEMMFDEAAALDIDAECGSISVHETYISASLKIDKSGADLNALERFTFRVAKVRFSRTGDAAKGGGDGDGDEADPEA